MTRVLLVDDTESARGVLAALLEDEGHHVVEAGSLAEGRQRAVSGTFELAIVDRLLPDGDGSELVRELSQLKPAPVVVVLSGAATEQVAGAKLCLVKGGSPVELLEAIAGVLGKTR